MSIRELRILPPLAIGRLGGAPDPVDNYDLELSADDPLAARRIRPAETLRLAPDSGELTRAEPPTAISFKDGGQVRPVAPFLELWALTDRDRLEPLTIGLLDRHGFSPGDVVWRVEVSNHSIYRRTRAEADRIEATCGPFSDHARHALLGSCANFWPGKQIPLGWVQYVKPSTSFPTIRLRFTPASGAVYGSSRTAPGSAAAARTGGPPTGSPGARRDAPGESPTELADVVYDASRGGWVGYVDSDYPRTTAPPDTFGRARMANGDWVSIGCIDDKCDGFVRAELVVKGRRLSSYARIVAAPPKYAPDSLPIRTVAHELEQALLGPEVGAREASLEQVQEILRRAIETLRLINATAMNGNALDGRADVAVTLSREDNTDTARLLEPIMAPSLVDSSALVELHRAVMAALRSGTAPWFIDVLRRHDEVGDLSNKGRRKMPALMRGSDGRLLALTRRQLDHVRKPARGPIFGSRGKAAKTGRIDPVNVTAQLHYRAAGNPPSTLPDSVPSNCYPGVELDFRNAWRHIFEGIELHEADNYVVAAGERFQALVGRRLLRVAGQPTIVELRGPSAAAAGGQSAVPNADPAVPNADPAVPNADPAAPDALTTAGNPDGVWTMEWSNSLANVLAENAGQTVTCEFTRAPATMPVGLPSVPDALEAVQLRVRPLFARSESGLPLAVIDEAIASSGELTQSLCAPWQRDFRGCFCFYWAATRPDYVNVEVDERGTSSGDNWIGAERAGQRYVPDNDDGDPRLFTYDQLYADWQRLLRFVVDGREVQ